MVDVALEIRPAWPFRLPGAGPDGVLRRRGRVLERLLHIDGEPAIVRVGQPSADHVLVHGRAARADVAEEAVARMRFAIGVDDDLRPFFERYRDDPWIGPSVRARPWLRVVRRPDPWEALAWAVTEQLIEVERAYAIQRRLVGALGRRCPDTGLRDVPEAAAIEGAAPARLESMDLAAGRVRALRHAAREVASGRVDLRCADHERGWRRLRTIPGIGAWTVEMLALHGQGRHDQIPAGDLGYIKLIGRLQGGGDPYARADEQDVRAAFARFGAWKGLAGAHALRVGARVADVGARPARRAA